jgi:predicted DNA-binding protein YlxM (UPF0122 family)
MTESKTSFRESFLPKFNRSFSSRQKEILRVLYSHPKGLTRSEISEITNFPRTTIYDNIFDNADCINRDKKIVKVKPEDRIGKRGRPKKIYYL